MARILRYILSIGLIVFILTRVDLNAFWTALKEVEMVWFVVALVILGINVLIRAYKWQILLRVHDTHIPFGAVNQMLFMSIFFNNFSLGTIGGDAFRIYRARGYSGSTTGVATSVVMERLTGFLMALVVVLGLGLWLSLTSEHVIVVEQLLLLVLCGVASCGLAYATLTQLPGIMTRIHLFQRIPKLQLVAEKMIACFTTYKDHRRVVVTSFLLSFVYHLTNAAIVYCFFLASQVQVGFIPLMFINMLVGVLIMIPVSINGLGLQEASYVLGLEYIGVAGPAALLVAVLVRVGLVLLSLLGGLLFLMDNDAQHQVATLAK